MNSKESGLKLMFIGAIFIIFGLMNAWLGWQIKSSNPTVKTEYVEVKTPPEVYISYIPVTVVVTPTPTLSPLPTPSPEPTSTPTPQPTKAPTATPKPKATSTPKPTKKVETKGVAGTKVVPSKGHTWKPWARHTAVTAKSSPQYKLEKVAITDSMGRRIAKDPNGVYRYLVALPVYWAGGTFADIGRCVDIHMANGATLKCVLADLKKVEHSINGQGMYGANNEILEVICDKSQLIDAVKNSGDASKFGSAWEGEIESITAYDLFVEF